MCRFQNQIKYFQFWDHFVPLSNIFCTITQDKLEKRGHFQKSATLLWKNYDLENLIGTIADLLSPT